jgi:hypothetical protein
MKSVGRAGQCRAIKKDGERCQGNGYGPKKLCHFHAHPEAASKCGQVGGKRRAKFDLSELADLPEPKTAADVKALLSTVLIEVRTGKLDTKTSANLAYISVALLSAIELEDLEKQIQEALKVPPIATSPYPRPQPEDEIPPELPPGTERIQ